MPIYAYACDSCGFSKDVLQKLSEAALTTCPECGKETFSKRLTAPAFQLKGSGWYVTDFRDNKGKTSEPATGSKTESTSSSAGETKSESAATAKSDSKSDSKSDAKSAGTSSSASSPAPAPAAPSSGSTSG